MFAGDRGLRLAELALRVVLLDNRLVVKVQPGLPGAPASPDRDRDQHRECQGPLKALSEAPAGENRHEPGNHFAALVVAAAIAARAVPALIAVRTAWTA